MCAAWSDNIKSFEEYDQEVQNYSKSDYQNKFRSLYQLSMLLLYSPDMPRADRDFLELSNVFVRDGWFRVLSFKLNLDMDKKPASIAPVPWINYNNYRLEEVVAHYISSFYTAYSAQFAGRLLVIVSLMRGETSAQVQRINEQIDSRIQTISDEYEAAFGSRVVCHSSSFCSSLDMLAMAFAQMLDEESVSRFLSQPVHNGSFDAGLDMQSQWRTLITLRELAGDLLSSCKEQQHAQFLSAFEQLLHTVFYTGTCSMVGIQHRVMQALRELFDQLAADGSCRLTPPEQERIAIEIVSGIEETGVRDIARQYAEKLYARYGALQKADRMGQNKRIQQYVKEHFRDAELNVSAIAEAFGCNAKALSASYKKANSISLREYIQQKRVDFAIQLLQNSELTLQEAAEQSGFGSVNTMYRAFHRCMHTTPGILRLPEAPAK